MGVLEGCRTYGAKCFGEFSQHSRAGLTSVAPAALRLCPLSAEYACVSRKAWSLLEPGARFILPVLVTESRLEDFAFLACSINL